ncbi:nuclear transport factor 2 family protein [Nocardia noduli]|uniref:nuclear transport factor 2 family protein n=1 Tax=Nocardia noduli TaxID=2815722 RepID=UPI0020B1B79D|nr:nuclear transport factor 2 family protein [Nocardia noduli]
MALQDSAQTFYELTQAKARYCHALDTHSWGALAELMTSDVVFDGGYRAHCIRSVFGRDRTIDTLRRSLDESRSVHQAHTPLIDVNGDAARVVWTVYDRIVWDDGHSESRFGHCREHWVRSQGTQGKWNLTALRHIRQITDADDPAPMTFYEVVRRATGEIGEFGMCTVRPTTNR